MAPRVKYLGQRAGANGQVMHDYEDERGNLFQVPGDVAGPAQAYEDEFAGGFAAAQHAGPEVQNDIMRRYSELAATTRGEHVIGDDEHGSTRVRLADAPADWDRLPDRVPEIPLPFGVRARPYDGLSPMADPDVTTLIAPGAPPDTARHEALHRQSMEPTEQAGTRAAAFNDLSPRDRVLYGAYKALDNEERAKRTGDGGHSMHRAYGDPAHYREHDEAVRATQEQALKETILSLRQKLGL